MSMVLSWALGLSQLYTMERAWRHVGFYAASSRGGRPLFGSRRPPQLVPLLEAGGGQLYTTGEFEDTLGFTWLQVEAGDRSLAHAGPHSWCHSWKPEAANATKKREHSEKCSRLLY